MAANKYRTLKKPAVEDTAVLPIPNIETMAEDMEIKELINSKKYNIQFHDGQMLFMPLDEKDFPMIVLPRKDSKK